MKEYHFPTALTFDDVLLEPQASSVVRSEVDISTIVSKKITLDIPIVAAAMDTISNAQMAIALGKLGGIAALHRNCTDTESVRMVKQVKAKKLITGVAVGPHDIKRAILLDKAGADVLFVDCACAHNTRILKSARTIKKSVRAQVIIGNIATREAAIDLVKFVDGIKVGVGPGSICTTRVVTGVGVPQLSALLDVVAVAKKANVPVIADGGLKLSGDVVKALAAGASTVMLGSMLAGTKETPGKVIRIGGQLVKSYRGMGSLGAMKGGKSSDRYFQKGAKKYVPEGVEGVIAYKGTVEEVIWNIIGGLRSGMGYIGAKTIAQLHQRARFIQITNASLKESHPHTISIHKKAPNY